MEPRTNVHNGFQITKQTLIMDPPVPPLISWEAFVIVTCENLTSHVVYNIEFTFQKIMHTKDQTPIQQKFTINDRFSNLLKINDILSELGCGGEFPSKGWLPGSTVEEEVVKERVVQLQRYFQGAVNNYKLLLNPTFRKEIVPSSTVNLDLTGAMVEYGNQLQYKVQYNSLVKRHGWSLLYYAAQAYYKTAPYWAHPANTCFKFNSDVFFGGVDIEEAGSNWPFFRVEKMTTMGMKLDVDYNFCLLSVEQPRALFFIEKKGIAFFTESNVTYTIYARDHELQNATYKLLHVVRERNFLAPMSYHVTMHAKMEPITITGAWPDMKIYQGNKLALSSKKEFLGKMECTILPNVDIGLFLTIILLIDKLQIRDHKHNIDGFS